MVSASMNGRLLPTEGGTLPGKGQMVEKGQVLAYVEPPLTVGDLTALAAERTSLQSLGLELEARAFDLEAKRLELQHEELQARARLDHATRAVARIEGLRAQDLGTAAELETARRDLEIARHEVEEIDALRASYAAAADRLADLEARSDQALEQSPAEALPLRVPLVAPLAGEIVHAIRVVGESVSAQAEVCHIVDLSRVWVVAQVSEFDFPRIPEKPGALIQIAGAPGQTYDLVNELGAKLVHVGHLVDPQTRTLEIHYEVPNPDALFRLGMFAEVHLETRRALEAVAVPEEAIVMDNGRPVAFVLVDGETFQRRDLVLGIRDGDLVEVRSGIEAGERVVTKGSYMVKLAATSPATFGEGHVH